MRALRMRVGQAQCRERRHRLIQWPVFTLFLLLTALTMGGISDFTVSAISGLCGTEFIVLIVGFVCLLGAVRGQVLRS